MKKAAVYTMLMLFMSMFSVKLMAQDLTPKQDTATEKWGYADKQGKLVIPYEFVEAGEFLDGLAPVSKGEYKVGYIDKTGKVVVPLIYSGVLPFNKGFAKVILDFKYGLVNRTGKQIIPCEYDHIQPLGKNGFSVDIDEKCGYYDKTGKQTIPCEYGRLAILENGDFLGLYEGKWVKIGEDGKRVD